MSDGAARRLARRFVPLRARQAVARLRRRAPAAPPPPARRARAPKAAPPTPTAPPAESPNEALLRGLERGRPLDDAVVRQVRVLLAAGEPDVARSLAEGLRRTPQTAWLGHLAAGVVAFAKGHHDLAHEELRRVPLEQRARLAAAEWVRAGLRLAPEKTLADLRALVAEDPPAVGPRSWLHLVGAAFGAGAADDARALFEVFDRRVEARRDLWPAGAEHRDWMRPWVARDPDAPYAPPPPDGRPAFAVMDYGHPGRRRASANIGDHVQSIASLGHLVRHRGVRLHGPGDLVGALERLGERTRPELRRDGVRADLEVLAVHRDASMYQEIPEGTWVLCFGWYMHALFEQRHGFPLHRALRPILVSFHCNKRDLLTPDAVADLRRYGPVGCRDWTTVYLLQSLDVPAFFSGCLTTTIDSVFPDLEGPGPGDDAPVAYVDVPAAHVPADGVTYEHSSDDVRRRSFVANLDVAVDLLETYRSTHRRIVTSRLHCALPARALGLDVDFRPSNRADIRFDGLIDLDDAAFDAIRTGLTAKLATVFEAILDGGGEDEVYARWRELTAGDVAAAWVRGRREHPLPAVAPEVREGVAAAVRTTTTAGPVPSPDAVHCAVILRPGRGRALHALVASLAEHAARPLALSVLALPGTGAARRELPARVPGVAVRWVALDGVGAGLRLPGGREVRPARIVRLLLAELLPDADRVVLLPLPSVVEADVAELATLDLGDAAFAAPLRREARVSGFGLLHAAAARLRDRPRLAAELRRTAHARHRFDFDAFGADVLVCDLARMRAERLADRTLPLVAEFGLDDAEALHHLAGPDRATVPERWAVAPTRSPVHDPALVWWPDRVKPWQPELTPERERWRRHDRELPEVG